MIHSLPIKRLEPRSLEVALMVILCWSCGFVSLTQGAPNDLAPISEAAVVGSPVVGVTHLRQSSGIAIQADGKIVTVESGGFGAARYNSDGSLDVSFGRGGKVMTQVATFAVAFGLALQADGKIIVVGRSFVETNDFALVRYNPDRSIDPNFGW